MHDHGFRHPTAQVYDTVPSRRTASMFVRYCILTLYVIRQ